jgi:hypothetical protein
VKHSSQSSVCWSSSSASNARQALSQTPDSSQSRKRRQQVAGDGYRSGKSFQRAPLRSTHKIPSKQGRFGLGFGPPFAEPRASGNNGSMIFHCSSVSSRKSRGMATPFVACLYYHKSSAGASLRNLLCLNEL